MSWGGAWRPLDHLDPSHPDYADQSGQPYLRYVSDLEPHPTLRQVVVATLRASPYEDGYLPTQLIVTEDAGDTWTRDDYLAGDLPSLSLRGIRFVEEYGLIYMYALGDCTSVYRAEDPWTSSGSLAE